jgi:HSP20 family protein
MSLRQAMDKLFEESFVTPSRAFQGFGVAMPIDMYQTENEVVVKTALPGVSADEVDITITGDTLCIRGEKKADEKVKREDYIYQEHRYGAFSRTVSLPGGLDTDKAEANFENGILTLTIPKSEEARPKSIKIKAKGEKK